MTTNSNEILLQQSTIISTSNGQLRRSSPSNKSNDQLERLCTEETKKKTQRVKVCLNKYLNVAKTNLRKKNNGKKM